jgi:CheY-like chemotaxis protein
VVRLRDDGIGIAPEMLPDVFELFKQGGHSPHHAPGLGVGLALVHRIVALHGGRVNVQSAGVNHGTEFMVSLPLLGEATTCAAEGPSLDAQPVEDGGARRILVIDDNVDAAESLAALLRLREHDVRVVHDGRTALKTATAFRPQVVFLDIAMPDMDGYEVARRLRQRPELEDPRLVAVTGFGRDQNRRLAKEAGFDEHVTKPLDPATLPALLARLGNRR